MKREKESYGAEGREGSAKRAEEIRGESGQQKKKSGSQSQSLRLRVAVEVVVLELHCWNSVVTLINFLRRFGFDPTNGIGNSLFVPCEKI